MRKASIWNFIKKHSISIVLSGALAFTGAFYMYHPLINNQTVATEQSQKEASASNKKDIRFAGAIKKEANLIKKSDKLAEKQLKTEQRKAKAKESLKKDKNKIGVYYYRIVINDVPTMLPENYQEYTYDMCKKYGIEEHYDLILRQMFHESSYNLYVVSNTNDYGLMQINAMNFQWLKSTLGLTDLTNPYQNIEAGVYVMSLYLKKYNNVQTALVCYNMGEDAVISRNIYSSNYSRDIVALSYNLEKVGKLS